MTHSFFAKKLPAFSALFLGAILFSSAQAATVNAICSTDQSWCEMAAQAFTKATGVTVLQTRKATGEALAQIRAEAANPKTDIWWGGTGDPFYKRLKLACSPPTVRLTSMTSTAGVFANTPCRKTKWAAFTPAPLVLVGTQTC